MGKCHSEPSLLTFDHILCVPLRVAQTSCSYIDSYVESYCKIRKGKTPRIRWGQRLVKQLVRPPCCSPHRAPRNKVRKPDLSPSSTTTSIHSACTPQMCYLFHYSPQKLVSKISNHFIYSWFYASAIWGVLLGLLIQLLALIELVSSLRRLHTSGSRCWLLAGLLPRYGLSS